MKQWIIGAIECKPQEGDFTNVIVKIHWRRRAVETVDGKEYSADVCSVYDCPSPGENFISYSEITKEDVESWLEAGLHVLSIDASLDRQIQDMINPPVIQLPLPWEMTTTTTTTVDSTTTTTTLPE